MFFVPTDLSIKTVLGEVDLVHHPASEHMLLVDHAASDPSGVSLQPCHRTRENAAIFRAAVSSMDRAFQLAAQTVNSSLISCPSCRSSSSNSSCSKCISCAQVEEEEVEIIKELQTILGSTPAALPNGSAAPIVPQWTGNDDICLARYGGKRQMGGSGRFRYP
jgi:hypothetical protein